ncbi:MAG: hypothetical protein EHM70_02315 [Chloroflexota bacterium]|nr:MAG: hypothetical protein EHM70_02315 [Chloroflexota bacterium]
MDKPVELIPLVCLKCATAIQAQADEVAWCCAQCGQGQLLDEEKGLVPLEIQFAAGLAPQRKGKPFWVATGQVTLQRERYSGNQNQQAAELWSQPQRFFVPAFACKLDDLLALGAGMLMRPPALQPGPAAPFDPVVLSPEDVKATAEFVVMSIEAERKDKLKEARFSLQLSAPVLWILP